MPWYTLFIVDKFGSVEQKTEFFPSKENLRAWLKTSPLYVIRFKRKIFNWQPKINHQTLSLFCYYMENLLDSKLSIDQCFENIQTSLPSMKMVISKLRKDLKNGLSLHQCFAQYPKTFDSFFVQMIKTGEETASLKEQFYELRNIIDANHSQKIKIKSALLYPSLIAIFMIILFMFMNKIILPELLSFLNQSGKNLPFTTQLFLNSMSFMSWFIPLSAIIISFVLGGIFVMQRYYFDALMLKIPFFGTLKKEMEISRYYKLLAHLLRSKNSYHTALKTAANSSQNKFLQQKYRDILQDIILGKKLHTAIKENLKTNECFKAAEEGGFLDNLLFKLAEIKQHHSERKIKLFTKLCEPTLIVIFGLLIIFIVLAIWSPIYASL